METIKANLKTNDGEDIEVGVASFNSLESGVIGSFYNENQVVKIGDVYVSLCNIIVIGFDVKPNTDVNNPYECSDINQCGCNEGLEKILRTILGLEYPVEKDITIEIIDNNAASIKVSEVYGICNGIIWVDGGGGGSAISKYKYLAIPLCSIFSIED